MSWVNAVLALLTLVSGIVKMLQDRQALTAAQAQLISASATKLLQDIADAQATRQAVRDSAAADPDSLRNPDPNSRD